MISCVIFDMDGVIIDSEPIYFDILGELFLDLGLELTKEEHNSYVGSSDMWPTVKERYNLDIDIDEIHATVQEKYLNFIRNEFDQGPIPGVKEVIERLHHDGMPLVLASSSEMNNIEVVLTKLDLLQYFDMRVSGADLETSKPHPEIFEVACKLAETPPEECLVIEDSRNGVQSAKAAGTRVIGFRNPNSGDQDLSDAHWIIDSFEDFDLARFDGDLPS